MSSASYVMMLMTGRSNNIAKQCVYISEECIASLWKMSLTPDIASMQNDKINSSISVLFAGFHKITTYCSKIHWV